MFIYINIFDKKLRTDYDRQQWELAKQRYEKAMGRKPKEKPIYKPFERGRFDTTQYQAVLGRFARWLAYIFALEVIEAIDTQKYRSRWEPLSDDYARWKKRHNYDPRMWIQTGFLEKQIDAYFNPNKGAWTVGIRTDVKYPGTDLSVLQVAKWMEYGTSRMPARPVFGPVQRKISRNIREYFRRFLNEVEMSRGGR